MPSHSELLLDLVSYVRSIQPRKKQVYTLAAGSVLLEDEDAQALPGVHLEPDDGVWVRVEKVAEPSAPQCPPHLTDVFEGVVDLATQRPSVKDSPVPDREEREKGEHSSDVSVPVDLAREGPTAPSLPDKEWEAMQVEARSWLDSAWDPWARLVLLARKSNEFYQRLFHVMTSLKLDGAAETQEIVCGIGTVSWKKDPALIHHPLLTQACEIVMLEGASGTLEIRPASTQPELSLEMFSQTRVPSLGVAKAWLDEQSLLEEIDVSPFTASDVSPLFQGLVERLDPGGQMVDAVPLPGPDLRVDLHWVFFMRERPNDRLWRDLDAWDDVLSSLSDDTSIPQFLRAMVDKSIHAPPKGPPIAWRGSEPLGDVEAGQQVESLYFPLPYNTEQSQIIEHLEGEFGAIVQGPPGTGKSHTIANVICHYLAHGKRILVAASSAAALEVVREKLPPQLRDLAAALLSSDAQGLADFEQSLSEIEHRLANVNPAVSNQKIEQLEGFLKDIHSQIAQLDKDVEELASGHHEWVDVDGQQLLLSKVAQRLSSLPRPTFTMPGRVPVSLTQAIRRHVSDARLLLEQLGQRASSDELQDDLPRQLPTSAQVSEFCQAQESLSQLQSDYGSGVLAAPAARKISDSPAPNHLQESASEVMEVLGQWQAVLAYQSDFLEENPQGWTRQCLDTVASLPESDPVVGRLSKLSVELEACFSECRSLDGRVSMHPVKWLKTSPTQAQSVEGLERLSQGQAAFPFWQAPFRKEAQAQISEVTVDGQSPTTPKEWSLVAQRLEGFRTAHRLFRRWNSLAKALGVDRTMAWSNSVSALVGQMSEAAKACLQARHARHELCPRLDALLSQSFKAHPGLGSTSSASASEQRDLAQRSFDALHQSDQAHAQMERWDELMVSLAGQGRLGRRLVYEFVGVGVEEAPAYWDRARDELVLFQQDRQRLEALDGHVRALTQAGFTHWPQTWSNTTSPNMVGIADDWEEAWRHRAYAQCLENMPSGKQVSALLAQRLGLVERLAHYITELSSERAWLGLVTNATPDTRRALKEYASAVRRQGGGQGRRAQRHRATARRAMEKAFSAIGCWIMPHGRVCESMPAELGLFDLVIIDEASQSDIQALPTLLRGKQLLIVGDDKQVSPEAVGVSEDKILKALNHELARQPYRDYMTQDRSLYDLFGSIFAGRDVMLREHFRSTEAIIAYSNRHYYHEKILPLRVPRADARLDPPLIDVLVRNGLYRNDVNMGEAEWIAEEIERLVLDPAYAGKTIGVVTLTSNDKQSIAIHNALDSRVPSHAWMAHELTVGPPPVFQGKERDIMFVSMVWDGRNPRSGANRTPMFEKRFNVAMSRGRDRVYLVRSNEGRPFRPDSLLAQVVAHFQDPIPDRPQAVAQTPFEKDLSDQLSQAGYRVVFQPGGQALGLDMMVEDEAGNRLGIQCDGDRPPGTDISWRQKMRRHRTLERSGWTIWRGFAANFYHDPDTFTARVIESLEGAGVSTVPAGEPFVQRWVEHREVGEAIIATVDEVEKIETDWPEDPALWPQEKELLEAMCDSPFEKEVLSALLGRGYRVRPQFPLGGYRIDFVVQGPDGSRLAVECDGDTFHGMDKYESDRARQAWLEKVGGLAFWRCWYSDWRARKHSCLKDLWQALDQAGVSPMIDHSQSR